MKSNLFIINEISLFIYINIIMKKKFFLNIKYIIYYNLIRKQIIFK